MNQAEGEDLKTKMNALLNEYGISEYLLTGLTLSDGGLTAVAISEIEHPQSALIISEIIPPALIQMMVKYNHLPPMAATAVLQAFVKDAGDTIDFSQLPASPTGFSDVDN